MGMGGGKKKPAVEISSAREPSRRVSALASWVIVDAPGLREIRSVSILEALCVCSFISVSTSIDGTGRPKVAFDFAAL
jgi:hypothetical protein